MGFSRCTIVAGHGESESAELLGLPSPIREHLHPKIQIHGAAEEVLDSLPGGRTKGTDRAASPTDEDLFLGGSFHVNGHLNVGAFT